MSTKDFVLGWVTGDLTPNIDGYTLGASAVLRILLIVFITYLVCLGSYRCNDPDTLGTAPKSLIEVI